MRKPFLAIAIAAMAMPAFQTSQVNAAPFEDVINVNISAVPVEYHGFFREAERFWDNEVRGFSTTLPQLFANTLNPLEITARMAPVDGVGGTLGFAGPDEIAFYSQGGSGPFDRPFRQWAISQTASMFFDTDDFASDQFTEEQLQDIVIHEMGHTLGLGPLWAANGFVNANGNYGYDGFALAQYRRESGNFFTNEIPIEQDGGGGTAGGHWEDGQFDTDGDGFLDSFPGNFFNQTNTNFQTEYMIGSINTIAQSGASVITPKFLSNTSRGSLEDIGWSTSVGPGAYDGVGASVTFGVDVPPFVFRPSVPEPGSMIVLVGMGIAALARRKR